MVILGRCWGCMVNNLDVGPGLWGLQRSLVEFSRSDQFTEVILTASGPRNSFCLAQVKGDLTGRFLFKFYLLEDNCFIMLWWSLPYIDVNRSSLYTCPLLLSLACRFHPSMSPTASRLGSCVTPPMVTYFTWQRIHTKSYFLTLPCPPSPAASTRLFCMSVSPFLVCK